MNEAPLYASAVAGYRLWRVDVKPDPKVRLYGAGVDVGWAGGVISAECSARREKAYRHPAPHLHCTCGIHAYYESRHVKRHLLRTPRPWRKKAMIGAIAGKGAVCCSHYGFRAEEAQIIGLVRRGPNFYNSDERIAELYGAPLFDTVEELEEHVRSLGLGGSVDPQLVPRRPPFWRNDQLLPILRRLAGLAVLAAIACFAFGGRLGLEGAWFDALVSAALIAAIGLPAMALIVNFNSMMWQLREQGKVLPVEGWYEDPVQPGHVRWWDGQRWTEAAKPWAQANRPVPDPTAPSAPQQGGAGGWRPRTR